jgi:exopolysaccharide biosynthesis polyprenyl glycosylphosphotransferase
MAAAIDAVLLVAAMAAAAWTAGGSGAGAAPGWLTAYAIATGCLLRYAGLYRSRLTPRSLDDMGRIVAATAVAAMAVTFARVLLSDDPATAGTDALRTWIFAAGFLATGRAGIRLAERRRWRRGGGEPTLIVGAGRVGRLIASRLLERPDLGLRPVALLDDAPLDLAEPDPVPVIGNGVRPEKAFDPDHLSAVLESAIREQEARHVVLAFSLSGHEAELSMIRRCTELGVTVSLVPRLFEGVPDQSSLERIGGLSFVTVQAKDPRGWQFAAKYALDRIGAAVAILVLSPLLAASAIAVAFSLGRPILFRQRRVGRDGQEFEMLKFRTMRPPAPGEEATFEVERLVESGIGPGGVEGGDRRTRVGRILRATSIDELPQLVNVLRGEMSLIGPRPERPELARAFANGVDRYADRSRVKSGITGWAQVHGLRGRTSLPDRVEWDNYYIENWSPWLDMKIVLLTGPALIRRPPE